MESERSAWRREEELVWPWSESESESENWRCRWSSLVEVIFIRPAEVDRLFESKIKSF